MERHVQIVVVRAPPTVRMFQAALLERRLQIVDEWATAVTTRTSPAPPQLAANRGTRRSWLIICAILASVSLLFGYLLIHRGASLARADRPSGEQLPLTLDWQVHDPATSSGYTIKLPSTPGLAQSNWQSTDDYAALANTKIPGATSGFLLLGRFGREVPDSPRTALLAMTAAQANQPPFASHSPIRRTLVGPTAAYAEDFNLINGKHLREFRFMHNGYVFSAGILWYGDDQVSLDTGLAALRTLTWTS